MMATRSFLLGSGGQLSLVRSKWPHNETRLYHRIYRLSHNRAPCRWVSNVHSRASASEISRTPPRTNARAPHYLQFEVARDGTKILKRGRRDAIDALRNLDSEPDDIQGYNKGVSYVQTYSRMIGGLSVEDAKDVIFIDQAGIKVVSWILKPNIRKLIEGNHRQSRILLRSIAQILVGAGHTQLMKEWIRHKPVPSYAESADMYKAMIWKGVLLSDILKALLWWSPSGSADPAYDFFSELSKEHFENKEMRRASTYGHVPMSHSLITLARMMENKTPASPESFDRLRPWYCKYSPEHTRWFNEANMLLDHPTNPTADLLLSHMKAADENNFDHFEKYLDRMSKYRLRNSGRAKWPDFIHKLGEKASKILRREGRTSDAEWLVDYLNKTLGAESTLWKNHLEQEESARAEKMAAKSGEILSESSATDLQEASTNTPDDSETSATDTQDLFRVFINASSETSATDVQETSTNTSDESLETSATDSQEASTNTPPDESSETSATDLQDVSTSTPDESSETSATDAQETSTNTSDESSETPAADSQDVSTNTPDESSSSSSPAQKM
ncbi:hypothetical protein F5Y13DRAFT_169028 [Hypoxylon sp. FL1857]|nr:hypothetical protein F5Y13DRAFT_169028 [Hypoxylon sp. FL1857]